MKKVPEDLARKLLEASNQMPDGSGFDVSIDDVARMTDIPRATLYYYFAGKDDLIEFYLSDLMDRTRVAIEKAAATEGDTVMRLGVVMTAMIEAFSHYPKMCLELPVAIRASDDYSGLMINMERSIFAPLREVLLDGRRAGDLVFEDVNVAVDAIAGALHMVSMKSLLATGSIDVDVITTSVVPQLIHGISKR